MPCSGCAKRREKLRATWHKLIGKPLPRDRVHFHKVEAEVVRPRKPVREQRPRP